MRRIKTKRIKLSELETNFDIHVDAKVEQVVMISANATGRKVVEDLWPDVEWATDEKFASVHSDEWLFTHIRITKLPPHLEKAVPLVFANPDSLGFAVALALQQFANPRRVCHFSGDGRDIAVQVYDTSRDSETARTLFAEHVPAGTVVGQAGRA